MERQVEAICVHLKERLMSEKTADARLHVLYFMNEMLSHAHKNKIDTVRKQMVNVIVACFAHTAIRIEPEKAAKCAKLLDIWEKAK